MNWVLVVGGLVMVLAALGHSITGEQGVLRSLDSLAPAHSAHVRLAWHLATIMWFGAAALLVMFARGPIDSVVRETLRVLGTVFLASSAFVVWRSRGRNPAGYLFAVAAVCSLVGAAL